VRQADPLRRATRHSKNLPQPGDLPGKLGRELSLADLPPPRDDDGDFGVSPLMEVAVRRKRRMSIC
jgi:hypothetical protein